MWGKMQSERPTKQLWQAYGWTYRQTNLIDRQTLRERDIRRFTKTNIQIYEQTNWQKGRQYSVSQDARRQEPKIYRRKLGWFLERLWLNHYLEKSRWCLYGIHSTSRPAPRNDSTASLPRFCPRETFPWRLPSPRVKGIRQHDVSFI